MLEEELKIGELDPKLWIALEDLQDGWLKSGTVGFGIGLYLASEILTHHDSQLQINSKEDIGSTSFFELDITS